MSIRNAIPVPDGIKGYERASIVGIVLVLLGSTMSWIDVHADPEAAAQLDDIEPGTTTFTGLDVNFGEITLYLGVIALIVLVIVLWRYRFAGRKTGLLLMLIGLISAAVAVIGVFLAGSAMGGAGNIEGVSIGPGLGVIVTVLGSLVLLSGGILRLAAGAPTSDGDAP